MKEFRRALRKRRKDLERVEKNRQRILKDFFGSSLEMFWNRQETPKSSASPKSVEEPRKKSLNQLEITERLHN